MKITKSQLREIIKEEIGRLNENVDERFVKLAINELSKKIGVNLSKLPYKKTSPEGWTIDISKELTKNPILSTLFKSLSVELITSKRSETESSIGFLVSINWDLVNKRGSNGATVGIVEVDKQSGKVKYAPY